MSGVKTYHYRPTYNIHQQTMSLKGFTDFSLPKDRLESYAFLDFVYEGWGIENIRLREQADALLLSIKSGTMEPAIAMPSELNDAIIQSFLVLGNVVIEGSKWHLVSGYRRTTFDLPNTLLDQLQVFAKEAKITMSEVVEALLREKLEDE